MHYKHSLATKEKIRFAHLKRKQRLGYVNSLEARKRMSIAQTGKKQSIATKRKRSILMKKRYANRIIYTLNCKWCNKKFNINLFQIKTGRKYCSHKCDSCAKKGKRLSPNTEFKKEQHPSPNTEFKKGNIPYMTGRMHSKNTKERISINQKGQRHSPKTEFKKGQHPSIKTEFKKGQFTREKNNAWKGGISRHPYGFDFNNELKNLIRKRDNYKCQVCGTPQEECIKKLPIHHIDYDKQNNNPKNLITLCISCNSKANYKREYWSKYFNKTMEVCNGEK